MSRPRRIGGLTRPAPPSEVADFTERGAGLFLPAPELNAWARAVFMDPASPLYSETHDDVEPARIGWLWTNERRARGSFDVLGEAAVARPPLGVSGWDASTYLFQLRQWFGSWWKDDPADPEPGPSADFRITLYAPWFAEASDVDALAVVKHELLHCMQAVDPYGAPRFTPPHMGEEPIWTIRRHDVEEFVEVVEWFGDGIVDGSVRRMAEAAGKPPRAGKAAIHYACGTCLRRIAA